MRPRLQLFLSVDIVGSTRLKQRENRSSGEQDWLPIVFSFLHAFPGEVEKACAKLGGNPGEPLGVWKLLGDEIIFTAEVRSVADIEVHLAAFVDALADRRSRGTRGIEVKGTAWIAGFPVANSILPLGDGSSDFLGASIDTGFRLARLSTPRRLSLSVELAWILLRDDRTSLDIRYAGRRQLDGVLVPGGYPAFYVDVSPSKLERLEDAILSACSANAPAMRRFCEAFVESHGRPGHLPFITGDRPFGMKPPNYDDDARRIEAALRNDVFTFDDSSTTAPDRAEGGSVVSSAIDSAIDSIPDSGRADTT